MQEVVEKMRKIRSRDDLTLPKTKYLRSEIDDGSGNIIPLNIRYYQAQGILHMIMVNRFLLGDDTGLGKCVVGSTRIQTDKGLIPISDLNPGITTPDTFVDVEGINIIHENKAVPVKRFYYGGKKPTRWIRTRRGFHIEGSLIHPVMNAKGEWIQLQDIQVNDRIKLPRCDYFPQKAPRVEICPADVMVKSMGNEWAAYLGLVYGIRPKYANVLSYFHLPKDRSLYHHSLQAIFGKSPEEIEDLKAEIAPAVRDWWRSLGFCPNEKPDEVPWVILQGTRLMVKAFLRNFFAIRARPQKKAKEVTVDFLNHRMAKDVQLLLWKMGILSVVKEAKGWWTLSISGADIHVFDQEIGWHSDIPVTLSDKKRSKPASDVYDYVADWGYGEAEVMDVEVDHPSHAFIADGITSHNTLQSIATSCFLWEKNPEMKVVVVTIKSAVRQWADEFERFTDGVDVFVSAGTPAKRAKAMEGFWNHSGSPSVLVMGYGSMMRDLEHYKDWEGYLLVVDEASAIKNHLTRTHKHIRYMSSKASRVIALTATMIENKLTEGWGIYNAVVPGLFGNYPWFLKEFCVTRMMPVPKSNRKIPTIVGYRTGAIDRFKQMIYPYFIGRSKMEVAKELPPLTRRTVRVPMSKVQWAKYQEALEGTLTVVKEGIEVEKETTKLSSIIYCQQIVDHPELIGCVGDSGKLDTIMELLTEGDLSDSDCKVIIFSRFKAMIDILMKEFDRCGISAVRITGDENEEQREAAKKAFQNFNSGTRVVCITTAARQGVNLQSAKAIVFVDTPWSAGDYIQLVGRMVRIGSIHDSVLAYHLVATTPNGQQTIDGHVMSTIGKKMRLVESVIGKRIKGDADEEIEVSPHNDISDLFEALQEDARRNK